MAVIVDQKRLGGGAHSTVGTVTDIYTALRLLFSRIGQPHVGYANAFSFNDPQGMCSECGGSGRKVGFAVADVVDMSKSLSSGAIKVPFWGSWELEGYKVSGFFDNEKKLRDYKKEDLELLLYGKTVSTRCDRQQDDERTYFGIIERLERSYVRRDIKTYSERTQKVEPFLRMGTCSLARAPV